MYENTIIYVSILLLMDRQFFHFFPNIPIFHDCKQWHNEYSCTCVGSSKLYTSQWNGWVNECISFSICLNLFSAYLPIPDHHRYFPRQGHSETRIRSGSGPHENGNFCVSTQYIRVSDDPEPGCVRLSM